MASLLDTISSIFFPPPPRSPLDVIIPKDLKSNSLQNKPLALVLQDSEQSDWNGAIHAASGLAYLRELSKTHQIVLERMETLKDFSNAVAKTEKKEGRNIELMILDCHAHKNTIGPIFADDQSIELLAKNTEKCSQLILFGCNLGLEFPEKLHQENGSLQIFSCLNNIVPNQRGVHICPVHKQIEPYARGSTLYVFSKNGLHRLNCVPPKEVEIDRQILVEDLSKEGYPSATIQLAVQIQNENLAKALELFHLAYKQAQANDIPLVEQRKQALAALHIASTYYKDPKTVNEALEWFKISANLGDVSAAYELYSFFKDKKDHAKEAVEWVKKSASGHPDSVKAMVALGSLYEMGELGVERDFSKSLSWMAWAGSYDLQYEVYRKAYRGDLSAHFDLIEVCSDKNPDYASFLLKELVRKDFSQASPALCCKIAKAFATGYIGLWKMEENSERAIEFYLKAAELGDNSAFRQIARIHETANRPREAIRYLEKGAKANDWSSFYLLFEAYKNQDPKKALTYLKQGIGLDPQPLPLYVKAAELLQNSIDRPVASLIRNGPHV